MRFAYHFSPSHAPLRFVTNHSRVTRVSRTPLCEQRSSIKTRTLIVGHPSQDAGRNAKENSGLLGTNRKRKPLLYSLTKTKYSSNNATVATFSQTLVSVIGYIRTQDRVLLPILDCCIHSFVHSFIHSFIHG